MKIKLLCFILTAFIAPEIFAQDEFELNGKVVSESNNLEGINVVNQSKNIGVATNSRGYFSIKASVSDTIIFSAVHLKAYLHIVTDDDKNKDLFLVPMEALLTELEEITLTKYQNITPEALGIIPNGVKKYTPAERKLKQASGEDNVYGLSSSVSLDAILNGISGRTKMLRKELEVEKKELIMKEIKYDYDEKYLVSRLKIPEDYVDGFYFYIVDEVEFLRPFKARNKTMTEFVLSKLASQYIELQELKEDE